MSIMKLLVPKNAAHNIYKIQTMSNNQITIIKHLEIVKLVIEIYFNIT